MSGNRNRFEWFEQLGTLCQPKNQRLIAFASSLSASNIITFKRNSTAC